MQMEDRLAAARTDVDEDAVILEAGAARELGDELEHPLRLVGRELGDVAERLDVALRKHEQVRLRLRVDVADRDEAVGRRDVVSLAVQPAEEAAVSGAAARIPSSVTAAPRTRTSSPTGASTSQGE